jgi:pseudouridine-5'-phosphate glycosidase
MLHAVNVHPEVSAALAARRGVVALESTLKIGRAHV